MNKNCYYLTSSWSCHTGKSKLIIILFLVLITASCMVKTTEPYYQPSSSSGERVRAIHRQPRTNSVILFERHGVIVGVNNWFKTSGGRYTQSGMFIDISFEIPDGKAVQLLQNHIEVSAPSKNSWKSELSGRVWTGPGRIGKFPHDALMTGKNNARRFGAAWGYGNTRYATYFFDALLSQGPELENLEVKIPKFLINDLEVDLPTIHLKLTSEDLWGSIP